MTTTDPVPARRLHRRRIAAATLAVVLMAVLAVFGWRKVQASGPDASTPSCSGPAARIENANSDQAGLIRCYLRAVADHNANKLRAVARAADDNGPTGFSASDFTHTADARSGVATVTVVGNDSDSADATVSIRYADDARETHEIHLANPNSSHSWRFWDIGSYPTDPNAPPPAAPEPAS